MHVRSHQPLLKTPQWLSVDHAPLREMIRYDLSAHSICSFGPIWPQALKILETLIEFDFLPPHPAVSYHHVFAPVTWNTFPMYPHPANSASSSKLIPPQHPVWPSTLGLLHWNYLFTNLLPSRAKIFQHRRYLLMPSPLITSCIVIITSHIGSLNKSSRF